jgi:hypothetical protein
MARSTAAGIQYHGIAGASAECEAAVIRLVQGGGHIAHVRILSHTNRHALLLTDAIADQIAIKSGFSSGYGGTGWKALSFVLAVLFAQGVEIDEREITQAQMTRLDRSALTSRDLELCNTGPVVRPSRWGDDYIEARDFDRAHHGKLWRQFPAVLPYSVIDPRLADLARDFWDRPDHCLTIGYRRLEDSVRTRSGLTDHGQKLFHAAFEPAKGKLAWPTPHRAERVGRRELFTGVFGAYRNPRQHREHPQSDALAEFLLLNHLFRLEAEAVPFDEAPALAEEAADRKGA